MTEKEPNVERILTLSNHELATLDEALAWVVQKVDSDFVNVENLRVGIETSEYSQDGQSWTKFYMAFVTGSVNSTSKRTFE